MRPAAGLRLLALEYAVHMGLLMTITMGQLVSRFFDTYEREFHDEEIAAAATQVRIAELLARKARVGAREATHGRAA